MAELVESEAAATRLAKAILAADRREPIVCVTIPAWASDPLLDLPELEQALEGRAQVWVMRTGDASWELSRQLPPGLDVYGGAVRLWWPGVDSNPDRYAHPLFFLHDRSEAPAVIDKILDRFEPGSNIDREPPPAGSEHAAVVTRVTPAGAELDLADGTPAFAHASHLSRHQLPPAQVVRVGQPVRVRVGEADPRRRRVPVSLLAFQPEPFDRLADAFPVDSELEAVVTELRNFGAFVEVLPDLVGLVHKSKISHDWVNHPEELLSPGQRVRVRLERIDESEQRIELSMLDIPADTRIEPASLYPDGPPWLAPIVTPHEPEIGLNRDAAPSPISPEQAGPAKPVPAPDSLASGVPPEPVDMAPAAVAPVPMAPQSPAGTKPAPELAPEPTIPATDEAQLLPESIARAAEARDQIRQAIDDAQAHLARLRSDATAIRRQLERELAEARRRILEFTEAKDTEEGSTQAALDAARTEAAELRQQLDNALEDRQRLLERLKVSKERAQEKTRVADKAGEDLRRERATNQQLQAQLERLVPDERERLRNEIRAFWLEHTTAQDRERYPWREPVIGAGFLTSLEQVHGVSRERVVEVCADVVCRRASERLGLQIHQLRIDEGGSSPQVLRDDGAKAYRASLQVHTPAARRLHYWELPDGGVELANIAYHDDSTIR